MKKVLLLLFLLLCVGCSPEQEIKELAVGDVAPDFAIKDLQDNIVMLSYYKNKPVVLRFFETDCRFCRADTPIINVYYNKYKDKGLEVFYIAANHETKEKLDSFVGDLEIGFPVIHDKDAKIADLYNVFLYPQTIMIAPDQKVLAIIPGGVGEAELDEMVGPFITAESLKTTKMKP